MPRCKSKPRASITQSEIDSIASTYASSVIPVSVTPRHIPSSTKSLSSLTASQVNAGGSEYPHKTRNDDLTDEYHEWALWLSSVFGPPNQTPQPLPPSTFDRNAYIQRHRPYVTFRSSRAAQQYQHQLIDSLPVVPHARSFLSPTPSTVDHSSISSTISVSDTSTSLAISDTIDDLFFDDEKSASIIAALKSNNTNSANITIDTNTSKPYNATTNNNNTNTSNKTNNTYIYQQQLHVPNDNDEEIYYDLDDDSDACSFYTAIDESFTTHHQSEREQSPQPIVKEDPSQPKAKKPKKVQESPPKLDEPPPARQRRCYICGQTRIPVATLKELGYPSGYKPTAKTRPNGSTGSNSTWDPSTIIKCSECLLTYHCGCTTPVVKSLPIRFEKWICMDCNEDDDEEDPWQTPLEPRKRAVISYKEFF